MAIDGIELGRSYYRLNQADHKKAAKITLKFLSLCNRDPKTVARILERADDLVFKGLSNCVYNLKHNPDIVLGENEKRLFRKHKSTLDLLVNPSISVRNKRRHLSNTQTGGFLPVLGALIPTILKTGVGLLGSSIFGSLLNRATSGGEQQ